MNEALTISAIVMVFMKTPSFSPAEVCDFFDIAKSTLLRWEKGKIIPAAGRHNGERRYLSSDVRAIADKVIKSRYDLAARSQDSAALNELTEMLSLCKLLEGSEIGLHELEERSRSSKLSRKTLKELLVRAAELDPAEKEFREIIKLVNAQIS